MSRVLLVVLALLASGCATTSGADRAKEPRLGEQIDTLRSHLHAAKSLGAMVCVPGPYARVQAAYRFAVLEKSQGDRARSRQHVEAGLAVSASVLDGAKDCPVRGILVKHSDMDPWLDGDGDGLGLVDDLCPYALEDFDGFEDDNGCPDPDNDQDGTVDAEDQCPSESEDRDGYEDEDGCPDDDNDADGIADVDDQCPEQGETINRFEDEDGCPDVRPKLLKVNGGYIQLEGPIVFVDAKSAELLATSHPVLVDLAGQLKARPDWGVRVEGHTSNRGKKDALVARSKARAGAVASFLIAQGLAESQVLFQGYGGTRPQTTNRTLAGRTANERVEIAVVAQGAAGAPGDAKK